MVVTEIILNITYKFFHVNTNIKNIKCGRKENGKEVLLGIGHWN